MTVKNDYSSTEIIECLIDASQPFKPQFLHFFSDIADSDLELIKKVWHQVHRDRKLSLLRDLEKLMEVDTLVSCDDFGFFALDDENPLIGSQAIKLLWECSDLKLATRFIKILTEDLDPDLTASAATGLGKFVLLGELEEIPEELIKKVKQILIDKFLTNKNARLRQRILESIGYVNNAQVSGFISDAIKQPEKEWVLSALFAINRSANETWAKVVLEKLDDFDPDIQMEALKAAGELEIASGKDPIFEILENSAPEEEIHLQAIWALSMIGGNDVRKLFDKMMDTSDSEEELEMLKMAMDNLELANSFDSFDMFSEE